MSPSRAAQAEAFRRLHAGATPLLLPNAWDAASAKVIEACGAAAIATTSAGLAWAHGWPDGDALPLPVLAAAVAEIARVVAVPVSADVEGGYSGEPRRVGEVVAAVLDAGAVGINLEDGATSPELLCAKIEAARAAATRAGIALFVNARADVYLRRLVPPEEAETETLRRAGLYRAAGADGLFVPFVTDPAAIRRIAAAIDLPLNVLVVPKLPPVAELAELGVRRVSAGAGIAKTAYGHAKRAATLFLAEGRYEAMFELGADPAGLNRLFPETPACD